MNPFASIKHPWHGANPKDVTVALVAFSHLLSTIQANRPMASEILARCDRIEWRNVFLREYKQFRLVDGGCADDIYREIAKIHRAQFPGMTPKQVLDAWAPPSPLTQAEIDAAWEIESDSCEEAQRMLYGDKHPKEVMAMLNDPKAHDPIVVRM